MIQAYGGYGGLTTSYGTTTAMPMSTRIATPMTTTMAAPMTSYAAPMTTTMAAPMTTTMAAPVRGFLAGGRICFSQFEDSFFVCSSGKLSSRTVNHP